MGMYLLGRAIDAVARAKIAEDPEWAVTHIDEAAQPLSLDKGWDVVGRYLTDGNAAGLFAWARPIGDETVDLGYGPPLAVEGAQLAAIAAALEGHDEARVRAWLCSPTVAEEPPYPFFNGIPPEELDEVTQWVLQMIDEIAATVALVPEDGALLLVMG